MKLVMVVKQMWPDGGIQLDKMVKNLFDSPARKGEPRLAIYMCKQHARKPKLDAHN
ncbi:MAG: hypothetical protein MK240_07800 [Opitutales bacterium]|nr:hypothetical protein [Opitutales bacterium]